VIGFTAGKYWITGEFDKDNLPERVVTRFPDPVLGFDISSEPTRQPCNHDKRGQGCAAPEGFDDGLDLDRGTQAGRMMAECGYFFVDFLALRVILPPFALDAAAPAIRKSSAFLPVLIAAVSQRGFNPRPAQVSVGFSGLRYLGAMAPYPRATFEVDFPPSKRPSFESSDSSARRCSTTLEESIASICPFSATSFSIDIDFNAILMSSATQGPTHEPAKLDEYIAFCHKRKALHAKCRGAEKG
jgi:hypothetical protein